MSCYIGPKLGELQERILNHFFQCDKRIEGIDHVSKAINAKEPSVSRSVHDLLNNKYLQEDEKRAREKGNKFFEKANYVTAKGIAYAVVMLGVKGEQIKNYCAKYDHTALAIWDQYCRIFSMPEYRNYIFRKMLEFFLINNIFDDEGHVRQLTEDEFQKMRIFRLSAAKEHFDSLHSNGIISCNDYLNKCGVDKDLIREYLLYRKRGIDWTLGQF